METTERLCRHCGAADAVFQVVEARRSGSVIVDRLCAACHAREHPLEAAALARRREAARRAAARRPVDFAALEPRVAEFERSRPRAHCAALAAHLRERLAGSGQAPSPAIGAFLARYEQPAV